MTAFRSGAGLREFANLPLNLFVCLGVSHLTSQEGLPCTESNLTLIEPTVAAEKGRCHILLLGLALCCSVYGSILS